MYIPLHSRRYIGEFYILNITLHCWALQTAWRACVSVKHFDEDNISRGNDHVHICWALSIRACAGLWREQSRWCNLFNTHCVSPNQQSIRQAWNIRQKASRAHTVPESFTCEPESRLRHRAPPPHRHNTNPHFFCSSTGSKLQTANRERRPEEISELNIGANLVATLCGVALQIHLV